MITEYKKYVYKSCLYGLELSGDEEGDGGEYEELIDQQGEGVNSDDESDDEEMEIEVDRNDSDDLMKQTMKIG